MVQSVDRMLHELRDFIGREQDAAQQKLLQVWRKPLQDKLDTGWTQRFVNLLPGDSPGTLRAVIGHNESRFREGDMLVLHAGDPMMPLGRHWTVDSEEDAQWVLSGRHPDDVLRASAGGPVYADPDGLDLTAYYRETLEEIAASALGREVVLPLLSGQMECDFDLEAMERAHAAALAEGFNGQQAHAAATACGANVLACIQGPPGTGKTRVLALVADLLVREGARVLVTSHTHMAINNALNKIAERGVPTAKVGPPAQRKGLDAHVACFDKFSEWADRPRLGYVVGATPFATCGSRLQSCEFDVAIFDEASQVTVPLALMAMRRCRRYVFIGDHKQMPPVVLSRRSSVLDEDTVSAFAALTSRRPQDDRSVMLTETYRMNRWLADWPSRTYYGGKLVAAGRNVDKLLSLAASPARLREVLDPQAWGVFVPTLERQARTRNLADARLVADLCSEAVSAGLPPRDICVVTPYRAQGRAIRTLLRESLGDHVASQIVADTVERMQGQERQFVILSLATADPIFLAAVAEFFFQPERLNVSITRAVAKLVVIGPDIDGGLSVEDGQQRLAVADYMEFTRGLKRVNV